MRPATAPGENIVDFYSSFIPASRSSTRPMSSHTRASAFPGSAPSGPRGHRMRPRSRRARRSGFPKGSRRR